MGAVLRDGLDGQLVLTQGGLLHDGDGLQGAGRLGALDDAARRRAQAGNRLHFNCGETSGQVSDPNRTGLEPAPGLGLTFDLAALAVLLRFALDDGGRLGEDGRGGDLLQDVDRLDGGLGGAGAHGGRHGVGHRLDGLR